MPTTVPQLRRDGVTVSLHAAFAVWGWLLFALGPLVPLLRFELETSRTVAGLHPTAMALGSALAALAAVPLVRRLRRAGAIQVGLLLVSIAALALTVGPWLGRPGLAVTLAAMFVTGVAGALLVTGVNTSAQAHHGVTAPAAISETNAYAAVAGVVAPLAVGAGVAAGLTYRPALLAVVPLAIAATVVLRRAGRRADRVGALAGGPPPRTEARPRPLPWDYWAVMAVVLCGVALEFVHLSWGAELLRERTALGAGGSSAAVAAVVAGMAAGRFAAVPLSRHLRAGRLLLAAVGVSAAGWALLTGATAAGTGWVAVAVAVAALFVSGLGIAAFFPIGSAWLVGTSADQAERGTGWLVVTSALAIGGAPFAVGLLSDLVGVWLAFFAVPVVLLLAVGALLALAARGRHG